MRKTHGLAARLREATAEAHRDTESRAFVTRLMDGELAVDDYVRYLAQYAYVYRALESRPAGPGDPRFLTHEALPRYGSIVSDLAGLGAADWEATHPAMPETDAYVERIRDVSDDLPRYVAHHYTRYLGDLSGGQLIARRLAEHYGLADDQLTFYRFDGIDRPGAFKAAYRTGLDSLGLADEDEAALIDEAKHAFHLNAELFDALNTTVPTLRA